MSEASASVSASASDAFELLTCLARTRMDEADELRARRLIEGGVDWDLFLRAANFHGQLLLVNYHMMRRDWIRPPDISRQFVSERVKSHRFKSQFLVNELCRVTRHLESREIPVMSIKGPTLARLAYGDVRLRWYGDLDLVVSRKSASELAGALREIGYELYPETVRRSRWIRNWKLLIGAQCSYVRGGAFYQLDVHTNVLPLHFRHRFPLSRLLAGRISVDLGTCSVPCPEPEVMLHVLCFHGQKNRWETLKYVCDLNELIRGHPAIRWEEVLEEARANGGLKVLLLGLLLARDLMSTPLPHRATALIEGRPELNEIAQRIIGRLPERHRSGPLGLWPRTRLHYEVQDSIVGKARYVGTALLQRLVLSRKGPDPD